ncbi:8-amino-7-oxononanoate synthase [Floricoccus penangensis]|uniref:8-amino-7-oxononanoate synthase n=1 Tax=Floricoccus penangensis TaxID=1859475 RepID=UPI00203B9C66|nr:8-amino-7-oxononanoate synthase [Floricoccus penangensis]URZ88253.1 8-amino-7-oxononanoate synthase [Floricoccus penangensis]
MTDIDDKLQQIKDNNLFRTPKYLSKGQEKHTNVDGRDVLLMSTNNYLGLSSDENVKQAAIKAIEKYGLGSGGSRLTSGSYDVHKKLEEKLAKFKGYEACLVFNTGYMANLGVISTIASDEGYYIFSDQLNHASIIDGCRLSKAKTIIYKHNDMQDLEEKIKENKPSKGMIVSDSVFSMEGDIANIPQIVELGKKYNLLTLVDDAHATGVIGKTGHGSCEYFSTKPDIIIGTLSKAIASEGGFACSSREIIDFLLNKARSFIYSTALTPAVICGSIESLDVIENNSEIVEKLADNIAYTCTKLKEIGFEISRETAIIPIPIGQEDIAVLYSQRLFEEGVFIPAIRYPTVAKGESILRLTLMATHDYEDIDKFIDILSRIKRELSESI